MYFSRLNEVHPEPPRPERIWILTESTNFMGNGLFSVILSYQLKHHVIPDEEQEQAVAGYRIGFSFAL
jgi:hypothetical protein